MEESESILETVRAMIVGEEDSDDFDRDLIVHINSMFNFLHQCGVGPSEGFSISDDSATWADFVDDQRLNMVKSYIALKTRLVFDPPTSSFVLSALKEDVAEMEWRLKEQAEEGIFE